MARHIRKGDQVIVTSGANKGRTGVVKQVVPEDDQVIIEGVNVRTVHLRPTQANPQGGLVEREAPIHISNVSPVVDGKPTRVRFETKPDGSKSRVAVRGGRTLGQVRGPRKAAK
jgi:large subunit ribosomal protein L24